MLAFVFGFRFDYVFSGRWVAVTLCTNLGSIGAPKSGKKAKLDSGANSELIESQIFLFFGFLTRRKWTKGIAAVACRDVFIPNHSEWRSRCSYLFRINEDNTIEKWLLHVPMRKIDTLASDAHLCGIGQRVLATASQSQRHIRHSRNTRSAFRCDVRTHAKCFVVAHIIINIT